MSQQTLTPKFVEYIPDTIEPGILYVSMENTTAIHKCCCGCGQEVVTPLSPSDWRLIFDGKTISLEPSIGNWGFVCQSHYWITRNRVRWAERWSKERIDSAREFQRAEFKVSIDSESAAISGIKGAEKDGMWRKIKKKLKGCRKSNLPRGITTPN